MKSKPKLNDKKISLCLPDDICLSMLKEERRFKRRNGGLSIKRTELIYQRLRRSYEGKTGNEIK